MANVCDNTLCFNCSYKNYEVVRDFLKEKLNADFSYIDSENDGVHAECSFDSRWTFPDEIMDELLTKLVDDDFDATCLSTEWGCLYTEFHTGNKDGWYSE